MKSQEVFYIQNIVLLYVAGCLVLITLFLNTLDVKAFLKIHLRNENTAAVQTKFASHEFSYIKPFTALVRFNKNLKELETKNSDQKTSFPNFPLLHLKLY